jgi:hypothetical protein
VVWQERSQVPIRSNYGRPIRQAVAVRTHAKFLLHGVRPHHFVGVIGSLAYSTGVMAGFGRIIVLAIKPGDDTTGVRAARIEHA